VKGETNTRAEAGQGARKAVSPQIRAFSFTLAARSAS